MPIDRLSALTGIKNAAGPVSANEIADIAGAPEICCDSMSAPPDIYRTGHLICVTAAFRSPVSVVRATEAVMKFRDILAIVVSGAPETNVVAMAQQLAEQNSGRVSGLMVARMPALIMTEGWVASPVWENIREHAQAGLNADLDQLRRRLSTQAPLGSVESVLLEDGQSSSSIAIRARHYDLVVMNRPETDGQQRLVESVLFDSGRPVMLVPPKWAPCPIGRNVIVSWTPTREASRALNEADDLLSGAYLVTILTVDMDRTESDCRNAGGEIAAHLARRGLSPRTCVIAPVGRTEAKAVLDHAAAIEADLIVMGGFGNSRMSEFIFGGMSREMIRTASLPILLAH